jgi:hypothetical protein
MARLPRMPPIASAGVAVRRPSGYSNLTIPNPERANGIGPTHALAIRIQPATFRIIITRLAYQETISSAVSDHHLHAIESRYRRLSGMYSFRRKRGAGLVEGAVCYADGFRVRIRCWFAESSPPGATSGLSGSACFPRRRTAGKPAVAPTSLVPTLCVGLGVPPLCGDSGRGASVAGVPTLSVGTRSRSLCAGLLTPHWSGPEVSPHQCLCSET